MLQLVVEHGSVGQTRGVYWQQPAKPAAGFGGREEFLERSKQGFAGAQGTGSQTHPVVLSHRQFVRQLSPLLVQVVVVTSSQLLILVGSAVPTHLNLKHWLFRLWQVLVVQELGHVALSS